MRKNREYKSDVFSMLMESKENALEVYNALNDSEYTNPEDVEIVQLERGVSLSIRNDASFIIDMNINLKKKSTVLEGYTYFVEKVRENQRQQMNLEEAVDSAIHDCIDHHVLEDFFRRRKDEVKKMTHLDYTWEKRERLIRMEEYADGKAEGMREGEAAGMLKGKAAGIREGEAVGKLKGKIDSLLEILQELGDVPEALQTRIKSEKDLQVLTSWLKAAARADSVEEFQAKAGLL